MADKRKDLSHYDPDDLPDGSEDSFGIVAAEWNGEITDALYDGAAGLLKKAGVPDEHIYSLRVPGTFEVPTGAKWLSSRYNPDAVICLGCVIKGETRHNEYINHAVSTSICQMGISLNKPFIFGILTTDTMEQAKARAGGEHGNKGIEAALTALKMAAQYKEIFQSKGPIGFQ